MGMQVRLGSTGLFRLSAVVAGTGSVLATLIPVTAVSIVLGLGKLMVVATTLADAVAQERAGLRRRLPGAR